jgi:hypothetical protein
MSRTSYLIDLPTKSGKGDFSYGEKGFENAAEIVLLFAALCGFGSGTYFQGLGTKESVEVGVSACV